MTKLPHPFNEHDYPGLIFAAEYSIYTQSTQVYVCRRKYEGGACVGTEYAQMVWKDLDPCNNPEPTIVCRDRDDYNGTGQLQFLFDALWELGMRPAGSAPSENLIAVKDAHIADLRTLLFDAIGIKEC